MSFDVIIVGQGIAGSLLAWKLNQLGVKVLVVDHLLQESASMVAAGIFNPMVFRRVRPVWLVEKLLPEMVRTYQNLENSLQEKILYTLPLLRLFDSAEMELWNERRNDEFVAKYIEQISYDKNIAGINSSIGYSTINSSGYVDLKILLKQIREFLIFQNSFCKEVFYTKDLKIKSDSVTWKGRTAKKIIFSEGYHLRNNPFFNSIRFYPVQGEIIKIYSEKLPTESIISQSVTLLPMGKNEFLVGATYNWKNTLPQTTNAGKSELILKLNNMLDHNYQIIDHRAGIRPAVADRKPVLGFTTDFPAIGIFNGLGTRGVMLGPYFADQMTRIITEANYCPPENVLIQRFTQSI